MIDYYDFLQISPTAEGETIHRVFHFLAARYHPDNLKSGDVEKFRLLKKAHDVLSDPASRAEYDVSRQLKTARPYSSTVDFLDSADGELNRRLAVLALLYYQRRRSPGDAEVSLKEIEERMGFPRDYLDFTLWYLKQKGYITRSDNAEFTLTASGVDFVEAERAKFPVLNRLLAGSSEPPAGPQVPAAVPIDSIPERRKGFADRRIGAPDLRLNKVERRKNTVDRRAGSRERKAAG